MLRFTDAVSREMRDGSDRARRNIDGVTVAEVDRRLRHDSPRSAATRGAEANRQRYAAAAPQPWRMTAVVDLPFVPVGVPAAERESLAAGRLGPSSILDTLLMEPRNAPHG
jgi:hypothetical protein